jgi:hypothetical protein
VRRHGARGFYLTRGDLPGDVCVERIPGILEAINRAGAEGGPFTYVLQPNRIERMSL